MPSTLFVGNTFTAYVDGTKVLTTTDSTYTSGGVLVDEPSKDG